MFDFLRKPGMRRPSAAIRCALEADGLPPGEIASLGVVESPGLYAGRKVSYFRVFDPQRAADRAVDVFSTNTYRDLSAHLDLVLRAGFIEHDGKVVVFSRSPAPEPGPRPLPAQTEAPGSSVEPAASFAA
jgi:hypothetical protein